MKNLPNRKTLRKKDFDYHSNGYYFVTFCTENQFTILGKIDNNDSNSPFYHKIVFSDIGGIVNNCIKFIQEKYQCIENYVVMPNHVHIIISIDDSKGNIDFSLSDIIGKIKSYTTKQYNSLISTEYVHLWQRSFHDRIIRNEKEFETICNYIDTNIINWELDCFYPK